MKNNPSKKLYETLKFQYAPLEKWLKENHPESYSLYQKATYPQKIKIMELTASYLGL